MKKTCMVYYGCWFGNAGKCQGNGSNKKCNSVTFRKERKKRVKERRGMGCLGEKVFGNLGLE